MDFTVSNMSCAHCKMTIEKAMDAAGVSDFDVDLENKLVTVLSKELSREELIEVIKTKGYEIK